MNGKIEITDVKIFLSARNRTGQEKTKAFASIVFNDCVRVTGIKVVEGERGLFVSLPRRKDQDGNFWQVVAPLNRETYQMIQDEVIHKYTVTVATQ